MSKSVSKQKRSISDRFLDYIRDNHQQVSIYLVSGFQLKGEIVESDGDAILFKQKEVHQVVMRSAVASMYPVTVRQEEGSEWWREYCPGSP